jgi:hypothetical protein
MRRSPYRSLPAIQRHCFLCIAQWCGRGCLSIGNQVCHAVGVANAFKLRREARLTVCITGDGGTSKGDFYEAMNLAMPEYCRERVRGARTERVGRSSAE